MQEVALIPTFTGGEFPLNLIELDQIPNFAIDAAKSQNQSQFS